MNGYLVSYFFKLFLYGLELVTCQPYRAARLSSLGGFLGLDLGRRYSQRDRRQSASGQQHGRAVANVLLDSGQEGVVSGNGK
jgi:hypothetical protein